MATNVDIINLTEKPVRIDRGAVRPYTITPFFSEKHSVRKSVITLTNLSGVDGFKLSYNGTKTAAFVRGTNCTAAAIQAALRTLTTDATLLVTPASANDDAGPFTVTFSDNFEPKPLTVVDGSVDNVITLTGFSGTDSFKLTYNGVETAAFVRQTNAAATDLQGTLRTATGDAALLVSGTTDAGPYTVTFSAGFNKLSDLTVTTPVGCTGAVTANTLTGAVVAASYPRVVSVDLDSISINGRRDLQLLLSSGSIIVEKTGTLDPSAVKVTNIALGRRSVRVGNTKLARQTQVTLNLGALNYFGRRDLINLLASGSVAVGTAATLRVVNISSKVVRIGATPIKPKRTDATRAITVNATTLNAAGRRDLQHVVAAGQVLTRTA